MPGRKHCTCVPQAIRDIQHQCFESQRDLLVIEDQIEAARQSIELPPNAPDIWNGNAPPTVEIEVHGALSVVVDDYIPEMRSILQRAATATVRSVSTEWNRMQHLERRPAGDPPGPAGGGERGPAGRASGGSTDRVLRVVTDRNICYDFTHGHTKMHMSRGHFLSPLALGWRAALEAGQIGISGACYYGGTGLSGAAAAWLHHPSGVERSWHHCCNAI